MVFVSAYLVDRVTQHAVALSIDPTAVGIVRKVAYSAITIACELDIIARCNRFGLASAIDSNRIDWVVPGVSYHSPIFITTVAVAVRLHSHVAEFWRKTGAVYSTRHRSIFFDTRLPEALHAIQVACDSTWEKQVLSARGFRRVGRHSEYAI
jgi:hypothetical protein